MRKVDESRIVLQWGTELPQDEADEKKDELTLLFEAGKIYYFRMGLRAGLWKGHGKLEPVDETTGEKEFGSWKAKLVYAKDVRKPDMVIRD